MATTEDEDYRLKCAQKNEGSQEWCLSRLTCLYSDIEVGAFKLRPKFFEIAWALCTYHHIPVSFFHSFLGCENALEVEFVFSDDIP